MVGEATIERGLDEAMEHAKKEMKKEVRVGCQRDGESHRCHVALREAKGRV